MSTKADRPQAGTRKISHKNEFELCYLRHHYLRRAGRNPTQEEFAPYEKIVKRVSYHTYYIYNTLFKVVGFEVEDLLNIAQIHLTSFLGLFSVEAMPEKYAEFVIESAKLDKNKINFTLFLKQRMDDLVRICRQKIRNVKGLCTDEYLAFYGPEKPPMILENLVQGYAKLGFRKIDIATFKSIKKKAKTENDLVFKFNNNWYVCVPIEKKSLAIHDLNGSSLDPNEALHNKDPETVTSLIEEEKRWKSFKKRFYRKSKSDKIDIIKNFIKKNEGNFLLTKELEVAKRMVKNLDVR